MGEMLLALAVAGAGGVGAVLRFLLDGVLRSRRSPEGSRRAFPSGIVLVNASGSFVFGLCVGVATGQPLWSVVTAGLLGGYTTFSTASADTVSLWRAGRRLTAGAHATGTLVLCTFCATAGILLAGLW